MMREIINSIVNDIAQDGVVRAKSVGFFPSKPTQYRDFRMLLVLATEDELIDLTHHDSPVVRCYAFWGLNEIMSKQVKKILQLNRHDVTPVQAQMFGCIAHTTNVAQFMKDLYTESVRKGKTSLRLRAIVETQWNTIKRRFYR